MMKMGAVSSLVQAAHMRPVRPDISAHPRDLLSAVPLVNGLHHAVRYDVCQ